MQSQHWLFSSQLTFALIQNRWKWLWWNVKYKLFSNIDRGSQPALQNVCCVLQHYSIKPTLSGTEVHNNKKKAKLQVDLFKVEPVRASGHLNLVRLKQSSAYCSPHTHTHNVCIFVCIWSLVGSISAFSLNKLHGLLFDGLDALRGAVLLLVLQVALEEELDLLHRHTQVDDAIKERPAGDRMLEYTD